VELHICAPHPAAHFLPETTDLLASVAGLPVTAVGPPQGATSLDQIVRIMDERRQSLGLERWIIWGMSGGSFLGQLYAHTYPEAVLGLILASSGPYFRPTVEDPNCILCPRNAAWVSKLAARGLLVGDYYEGDTTWDTVEGVGWVFRRTQGAALLVSPDEPSGDLRRIMPALWAFDSRSWLSEISSPALVMCGTADPIVPLRHARALSEPIPNERFIAIENAGHVPLTDRREEVQSAIRTFLSKLSLQ
jgi:pimeloyl-ACP methyl ester carboxylesterase